MTNIRVLEAIQAYKKTTKRFFEIPYPFIHNEPIWTIIAGDLLKNDSINHFIKQWAPANSDYSFVNDFKEYCDERKSDLMYLIQGAIDTTPHPRNEAPEMIHKENREFCLKFLKIINITEEQIWQLLHRERFFAYRSGVLTFEKYITYMQKQDPKLNCNSIALFLELDRKIAEDGSPQLRGEYGMLKNQFQTWLMSA